MALSLPTNLATVEAWIGALYGYAAGSTTMAQINSDITGYMGLNNTLNAYFTAGFGSQPIKTVASTIVSNVGLGTDANAIAYVSGVLTAAAPSARGAAVSSILNAFANLTSDTTYGKAATAWVATVANSVTYAQSAAGDATLTAAATVVANNAAVAASAGQSYPLTAGVDTLTGTTGNDTFTAADGNFTPLDNLVGGGGQDVFNITNTSAALSTPTGATTSGIQTINISSTKGVTFDTSTGFAGLTLLTASVTSPGAVVTTTAASTTNQTITVSTPATNQVTIYGGLADVVTVTDSGANTDPIVVGSTTKAPAGPVTVNSTQNATTGGAITVTGGTVDTINSTMTNTTTGAGNGVTGGAITVNGTAITTSVVVNQAASVSATTAVTPASAGKYNTVSATAGIAAGAVTITDANNTTISTAPSIATVTLKNYGASTITSSALTTLTLSASGSDSNGAAIPAGGVTLNSSLTRSTNTALTINVGGGSLGAISDNIGFATYNIVASTSSTLGTITNANLTTVNLSGTGVVTLGTLPSTVTSINVTGAAAVSATLPLLVTSINAAASTGANSITLANGTQSFTGGSGANTVTTAYDVTGTLAGGSGSANILKLTATTNVYTASKSGANISGFQILDAKPGNNTVAYNLANFPNNTFTKLIAEGETDNITFTNVVAGTPLQIKPATNKINTGTVSYNTTDYNGLSDSVTVTLSGVSAGSGASSVTQVGTGTQGTKAASLTFADGAGNGIGTVNFVTDATVGGGVTTVTTLVDTFMSNLNISGTGNLIITNWTAALPTLTISDNDTSTGTSSAITNLTIPASFSSLSYSGTQPFAITNFITTDTATSFSLTNANTGSTGILTTGSITLSNATTVRLNGSVSATIVDNATGGVTVNGSTDNQAVTLTLAGAAATKTDTITLGNGNNVIVDSSTNGTVNITVGTGYNTISVPGAGAATFSAQYNVTVGSHVSTSGANVDTFNVGTAGTYFASQPNVIISGAVANDVLNLASAALSVTSITAGPTLATTITALQNSHNTFAVSVFGGNTYVYADSGAAGNTTSTFVEIIGVHTFTALSGVYTFAS